MDLVIVPDLLYDGTGNGANHGYAVALNNGSIVEVAPKNLLLGHVPATTRIITYEGCTLLPGLIDAHVHLGWGLPEQSGWARVSGTPEGRFAWSLAGAQAALSVGVTTQRDCGAPDFGILRLRDVIKAGLVVGPTILASGPCITTTGGHGDFIGVTADSAPDIRKRVRELCRAGVDFIKVMASGGDIDPRSNRRHPQYSLEEMCALVGDAHRLSLPVVAHCNPTAAIRQAVTAGVDTIAHCNWLGEKDGTIDYNADVADQLLASGTFIDLNVGPTIAPYAVGDGKKQQWPTDFGPANRWELHKNLRERGAKILLTSDAFGPDTAGFPSLLARMVTELGLDVAEVVHRATEVPAHAIGRGHEVGVIAEGYTADLALFDGNLEDNPSVFDKARHVWSAGRLVSSRGRLHLSSRTRTSDDIHV